jgi:hypothetical protein
MEYIMLHSRWIDLKINSTIIYMTLSLCLCACEEDQVGQNSSNNNQVNMTTDISLDPRSQDMNMTTTMIEVDAQLNPEEVSAGFVDFRAIYEAESAWESNTVAQQMVEQVFTQFEATLRTAGTWDTIIEIYLTDDNLGFANTSFNSTFLEAMVDEQMVLVVPAWQKLMNNIDPNGSAQANGLGTEFTIHFNVNEQANNAGLLRHEIMHGLGAVNALANMTTTIDGTFVGPDANERIKVALYDLNLYDLNGQTLVGDYNEMDQTFAVQNYMIETILTEWMDGDGGVFFRGIADNGSSLDMACGTFPLSEEQGILKLNEPLDVMSAVIHPSWNEIAEPDRAFLRAMKYQVVMP